MTRPNHNTDSYDDEFDIDRLRYFMSLSVEEKLKHLEQVNELTQTLMPEENRKIWERLKEEGC